VVIVMPAAVQLLATLLIGIIVMMLIAAFSRRGLRITRREIHFLAPRQGKSPPTSSS
jgi:hypothetical protein